jgi:hypothetical protein
VISDPWIDRTWSKPVKDKKPRVLKSDAEALLLSKLRRDQLREEGRCINGPTIGDVSLRTGVVHGAIYKGGRCERCYLIKCDSDDRAYQRKRAQRLS